MFVWRNKKNIGIFQLKKNPSIFGAMTSSHLFTENANSCIILV